ncbi:MAG: hypothetical protein A2W91_14385 [Bacteroidetes bacterium GWF2_38_335]|nr:MAG: hypothetical protein A2W91_14385 [Bacteroidetes bacterium GWF2_38_335]OFY79352.1 MAG: hypothetical protein A2281_16770 [Bacteroidetes bacterium RIFOXYA12_FULL_38_20]HBS85612.1 hypothetical protein [Bacteroidales bacterium]
MKFFATISILTIFFFCSFSQTKVKLGIQEEIVYPFELNQVSLYLNWTQSTNNFDSIKVFGMGEATHGTREFFNIKAETFKYLVTNCNYKIFGIEASYGECNYINDYLNTGNGNIDTIIRYFSFWTWQTEEVKDLILWIKDYNLQKTESNKILFYGFDMQDMYYPIKYFFESLKSDSTVNVESLITITKPILTKSKYQIYQMFYDKDSSAFHDTLKRINVELEEWMSKNEPVLRQRYSIKRIKQLQFCLTNYNQAITNDIKNYQFRDSCMAYNIVSIQNLENAKMFIWAHNGHINIDHSPSFNKQLGTPMGGFLKKAFGQNYYSIGFTFNRGFFHAVVYVKNLKKDDNDYPITEKNWNYDLKECYVPVYKKNTFTKELSRIEIENFFIDIRYSSNALFSKPFSSYSIGAVFINKKLNSQLIYAKKQFDGLIYIDRSTSAIPIKSK